MITSTETIAAFATWGAITALFTAVAVARRTMFTRPGVARDAMGAYLNMGQTLGSAAASFKILAESRTAGAWAEFQNIQLNPNAKLDAKTMELIGLAVAAQIPCPYCIYGHTAFAMLNGATDEEVREAVAMAATIRHCSTVLNGTQIDLAAYKKETESVVRHAEANTKKTVSMAQ